MLLRLELPFLICGGTSSYAAPRRSSLTTSSSLSYSKPHHHQLTIITNHYHRSRHSKKPLVVCNSSSQSKGDHELCKFSDGDDYYYKAVILMTETIRHYQKHIQGAIKWQPTGKLFPLSKEIEKLLSKSHTPTIFLKISQPAYSDSFLPIPVGECAVESLIRFSLDEEESNDQLQLEGHTGYQVKLVLITKGVDKSIVANICFYKPDAEEIRVYVLPSDAINVAKRCRAPIYVSGKLIETNGTVFHSKMLALFCDRKPTYEVYSDSAMDGPDILAEEFNLVSKMNLAVKEERYIDADQEPGVMQPFGETGF